MSWPVVKLGGLVSHVSSGATPKGGSENYSNSGPVMFLRSQNIHMNELRLDDVIYINEDTHKKMKRSVVQYGDVLLNITGASIGRVAPFELKGVEVNSNQHVCTIRPLPEALDYKYLSYFLGNSKFQEGIFSSQRGGTREALNYSQVRDFEIPLPPLEEQKRIAAILDKAGAIRRKRQQAIKLADDFLRSVFLEMFGDPVNNPKGWKVTFLSNLVSKLGDGLHGTPVYDCEGDFHFINGNNLENGKIFIGETVKRISQSEYEKHKKDLNENTMLVSINGTIGKVAFYNGEKIALGKSACYFNLIPGAVNKTFIYHLISSDYFKNYVSGIVTGSTIKNVSLKSMREFPVPLPPPELQSKFSDVARKIESIKEMAATSLMLTDISLSAISQKAFSGEL